MLNHFRTLLMNVRGSAPQSDYLAEEVVDPDYVHVTLPTELTTLRTALFGVTPDRHMLNVRCRQLLALVHASPLVGYVTKLDPRVTYDFTDPALLDPATWAPRVAVTAGTGTLAVYGTPAPPDASGVVGHRFLVTVDAPGEATVERVTRPAQKVVFAFTAGDKVPLPLSGTTAKLASAAPGQGYTVSIYSRPARDAGALAAAASNLGEPTYLALFGVSPAEPFKTFANLWAREKELPLKLGGLVCALAYRTEELRGAT